MADADAMFKPIGTLAAGVEDAGADGDAAAGADGDDAPGTTTINSGEMMSLRSLCVACMDQGVTNMLLTRVPFFRDIIIMAFDCEHCGYRSSEAQSAEVQERGVRFELHATTVEVRARVAARRGRRRAAQPRRHARAGLRVPRRVPRRASGGPTAPRTHTWSHAAHAHLSLTARPPASPRALPPRRRTSTARSSSRTARP
jgi:hypothetical protein